ncbi:polysaccharide lyase [Arachidicoccus sp.]|uniref:polysaccharide lyase n=1 Tax=Arachidicoccus sp. TaxID=1872624 RepID=UPI003D225787
MSITDLKAMGIEHLDTATGKSILLSTQIIKDGLPSFRFDLKRNDKTVADGKRAEIAVKLENNPNADLWFGFNMFLPVSYIPDPISEIVAQWHARPDFNKGETWRSPPIALSTKDGHWWLNMLWAKNVVNTNKTISGSRYVDLGEYQCDQWTNWTFHIRFSYKSYGIIEVWKNKKMVYNHKGPNYYNDKKGPYFKFGIYKWEWMKKNIKTVINERVLYFNNIKISGENLN